MSTCRVRIYVPVDSSNNYKTTANYPAQECRGHYDFQICKSQSIGTASSPETFQSPIISYGHNALSEVAFFESGRESTLYSGKRVRLFYWSFTASDTAITELLKGLGGYLDGDNPDRDNTSAGKLVRYDVIKSPYNNYSVGRTNCFRAVASWTNALGKSQLQTIYNNAHSSSGNGASDYYAYKLANSLSAYWTDKGIKSF